MSKIRILTVIIIFLFMASCRKDELTLPAKVLLEFELIPHEEDGADLKSGPPSQVPFGKMTIDQGKMIIGAIEFDGRREEGKDVFFVADLNQPVIVDMNTGSFNQALSFDIPQGVYNLVDFYFELENEDEIPLVLEGKITRGPLSELLIRFEYDIPERFSVRAGSKGNSREIILRKDNLSKARIILDARYIFQFANLPLLRDASISTMDGKEVLLISSTTNVSIFNKMADRLEKSMKIIID
jgi:hypothetical protein